MLTIGEIMLNGCGASHAAAVMLHPGPWRAALGWDLWLVNCLPAEEWWGNSEHTTQYMLLNAYVAKYLYPAS